MFDFGILRIRKGANIYAELGKLAIEFRCGCDAIALSRKAGEPYKQPRKWAFAGCAVHVYYEFGELTSVATKIK